MSVGQRKDSFNKKYWNNWLAPLKINLSSLVPLSFCNRIAYTSWLLSNGNVLLTVPEAKSSKIKALVLRCLVRACFLFTDSHLCIMSTHGRKGEGTLWGPSSKVLRTLIPFMRSLPSLPKGLTPKYYHIWL